MEHTIGYLNSDLDLTSGDDLTALAAAFETEGIFPLHVTLREDRLWYATFETDVQHAQPDSNIAAMLTVIEALPEPLQTAWAGCTLREFNIGYDCGCKPWAFNQRLSSQLLGRIAAAGASLRITLYPPASEKTPDAAADAAPK